MDATTELPQLAISSLDQPEGKQNEDAATSQDGPQQGISAAQASTVLISSAALAAVQTQAEPPRKLPSLVVKRQLSGSRGTPQSARGGGARATPPSRSVPDPAAADQRGWDSGSDIEDDNSLAMKKKRKWYKRWTTWAAVAWILIFLFAGIGILV
jgi:hypothetical protein